MARLFMGKFCSWEVRKWRLLKLGSAIKYYHVSLNPRMTLLRLKFCLQARPVPKLDLGQSRIWDLITTWSDQVYRFGIGKTDQNLFASTKNHLYGTFPFKVPQMRDSWLWPWLHWGNIKRGTSKSCCATTTHQRWFSAKVQVTSSTLHFWNANPFVIIRQARSKLSQDPPRRRPVLGKAWEVARSLVFLTTTQPASSIKAKSTPNIRCAHSAPIFSWFVEVESLVDLNKGGTLQLI